MKNLKLNDGRQIPPIGFGTWQLDSDDAAENSVAEALRAGYRLIDTARIYGNEQDVGKAVRASGISRDEIFVTTKLWTHDFGYDNTMTAFDESLERLGLEYVDLYLIHWPGSDKRARHDSWRALIEINGLGTAKSVGVSNFKVADLEALMGEFDQKPSVNQIEFHPFIYHHQAPILEFCASNDIVVEAYSPLDQASQMDHPVIQRLAESHKKSAAQIMLRWAVQHGTVPIPKSSTPERIHENLDIFDFKLSAGDMDKLDGLST